ncbi:BCCT family transporter [uncultured Sutterella sp.]|uniref:BCCT family transporter n=1 Tax=uncultured Sutterella sp. TaxID=286133 RepID=UPI00280BB17C|nr:BCCT family transporter [uncultured Sutterella sp.]
MIKSKKTELAKGIFWPSYLIAVGVIICGILNQKEFGAFLNKGLDWVSLNFGWWLVLFSLLIVLIVAGLAFSKAGDIVIGGPGAKPEYTTWQWFSMSLKGGIGTGILFWAMGEPIFHMAAPPAAAGAAAMSREAGIFAVSQTMLHWTIAQYAMYSICAVGIALMAYNRKSSISITSIFEPYVRSSLFPTIKTFITALSLICIVGALACSMAVGIMQINSGLDFFFGIPVNNVTGLAIAGAMVCVYVISCLTGIKKGMRILSSFCTMVFIGLMIYVLVAGPTLFVLDLGTESLGQLFNRFFEHSVILPTMTEGETWSKSWIIQFMAAFFVYAPIIGLFLARLGRGRTVRQFILMNIGAPSLFCIVWIAIWVGATVWLQYSGTMDVWQMVNTKGLEVTIFTILDSMPFARILAVFFIIAVFFSFSTMADSITGTMATLSTKNLGVEDEAPRWLKVIWGVSFGVIGYLLVASGGADSVRGMFTIVGLPISLIVIAYVYCTLCESNRMVSEFKR